MNSAIVQHSKKSALSGLRILVTRQDTPESSLSVLLQSQGATVVAAAMTKIIPPESWQSFDKAVKSSSKIDWVVFTSSNGVSFCVSRLKNLQIEPQFFFSKIKIACVGQSTSSTLSKHGITAELIPSGKDTSFLFEELDKAKLDWIIFASPSAVQNFHQVLPDGFWESLMVKPKIACLGETTESFVKRLGWSVQLSPEIQDFEHLVTALCQQK